jgi:hypothetical protein
VLELVMARDPMARPAWPGVATSGERKRAQAPDDDDRRG